MKTPATALAVYIETDRPAKIDSRGIPFTRDDHVLVVGCHRYLFPTPEAAAVACSAVLRGIEDAFYLAAAQ